MYTFKTEKAKNVSNVFYLSSSPGFETDQFDKSFFFQIKLYLIIGNVRLKLLDPLHQTISFQILNFPLSFLSCRRSTVEPNEYPMQPWAGHRDPMHYPNPQPGYHPSYPPRDNYPRPVDPRQNDSGFYHTLHSREARFDRTCPLLPPFPSEAPRFDTMNRGGYRNSKPRALRVRRGTTLRPKTEKSDDGCCLTSTCVFTLCTMFLEQAPVCQQLWTCFFLLTVCSILSILIAKATS